MKNFKINVRFYECDCDGSLLSNDLIGSFKLPARQMSKASMTTFCLDFLLAFVKYSLTRDGVISDLYSIHPCSICKFKDSYISTDNLIFAFNHYYNFTFEFNLEK